MNKSELIDVVAKKTNLSKNDAGNALNAVLGAITDTLKDGDQISLVGFGTFYVKERAARVGRNPKTGAALNIPAAKIPGFKPGKGLKDSVDG